MKIDPCRNNVPEQRENFDSRLSLCCLTCSCC